MNLFILLSEEHIQFFLCTIKIPLEGIPNLSGIQDHLYGIRNHLGNMPPWTSSFLSLTNVYKYSFLPPKIPWKVSKTTWKVCLHESSHSPLRRSPTPLSSYHRRPPGRHLRPLERYRRYLETYSRRPRRYPRTRGGYGSLTSSFSFLTKPYISIWIVYSIISMRCNTTWER